MRKTRKSVSTKKEISQCKTLKEKQEDFIMLPTVDFCFKELMQNDNIRKNIIAALLNVPSSEIEKTELMPTILRKESKDDKYGILDVRVKLKDGEQIDFEMQPPMFKISDTHYAATWLLHPDAPKVELPKIITERIARMKSKGGAVNAE